MSGRVLRRGTHKSHGWAFVHTRRCGSVYGVLGRVCGVAAGTMGRGQVAGPRRKGSPARLVSLACCVVFPISVGSAGAKEPTTAGNRVIAGQAATTSDKPTDSGCGCCHFCDRPTRDNKCLLGCNRSRSLKGDVELPGYQGPDVIILDELESAYLPVPFDHKGHAYMAEMVGGCVTCHHYTPEGRQHPACKTCHDLSDAEATIDKPGLRGAYHQQCLNCHREWINEKDCDLCHRAKTGRVTADALMATPTKDDILGLMHPPIPEPDTDIYTSRTQQTTDTQVIFRHRKHVDHFGLRCVECHHERSCVRCHTEDKERQRRRTRSEHHGPCIRCHKHDMDLPGRTVGRCERCHWREGQPKPEPFNHVSTGWPLTRFHEGNSCRDCHTAVPFVKLHRDCNTCHSHWGPLTFDHRVTGQVLDDNHAEHGCEVCHVERKFDRPPTCDECHDEEDDGIAFPARRPGPEVPSKPSKPGMGARPN